MSLLLLLGGVPGVPVGPVVLPVFTVRESPPLRSYIELVTPSGRKFRWAPDEPDPANVFSGLGYGDAMPGGYEQCDCSLPRKPGTDYVDLDRLSTMRVRGPGGEVFWEGRLERTPRSSGDKMAISPSAVGWQAALDDKKSASMIYVDRDLGSWRGPSPTRELALEVSGSGIGSLDVSHEPDGDSALVLAYHGPFPTVGFQAEAYYEAPSGVNVGHVWLNWATGTNIGTGAGFNFNAYSTENGSTFFDGSSDALSGATSGTLSYTPATARRMVLLHLEYPSSGGADLDYQIYLSNLVAHGDHGLTKRGTEPDSGYYGSDIVAHAVATWAPALNFTVGPEGSIRPSAFIIYNAAYPDLTSAGEIVRDVSEYEYQDWAVWDDRTMYWHDRGTNARFYHARVGLAQLQETGPQADRLWESIVVQWQDVDGSAKKAGPPGSGLDVESEYLKDTDPENPANRLGIPRQDVLQVGISTADGAVEIGRRFLEQTKLLDGSGQAVIVGYVKDDRGVLHPYSRVRAGDYIGFDDAADPSYRRIVKTQKDDNAKTCTVDLDAPAEGLQALLERLSAVLAPLRL